MSEPMLGQLLLFSGAYNPRGWAYCSGELVEISTYSALYSIFGTTYGGDGRSTLGLPDLRGRSPLGMGSGPGRITRTIGASGGIERVGLVTSQMPSHTHASTAEISGEVTATTNCYTGAQSMINTPANNVLAQQGFNVPDDSRAYSRSAPNATMSSAAISTTNDLDVSVEIDVTGEGDSHENMHPWACLNYIIALEGYYPSRT